MEGSSNNNNNDCQQSSQSKLLEEMKLGPYQLRNRVIMSPLTRIRADPLTGVPNDLHIQYYTERAIDAGLVITECSPVSRRGNCFPGCCGIWTDEQVEGWKKVIESVHKNGGRIYLQIWHCGRAAKSDWLEGQQPLSSSAVRNRHAPRGGLEYDTPQEMTKEDIQEVLTQFRKGAENAKKAGFDGLELHAANGYLVDQFLRDAVNQRKDEYGGSVENRCRFALEVMDNLIDVFGADKVGIKVTPTGRFNDMFDSDPVALYTYLFSELNKRNVSFVEITRAPEFRPVPNYYNIKGEEQIPNIYETFRPLFKGIIMANNGFNFESGSKIVEDGLVDFVTFGRLYISNPDLVYRFKNNFPLTIADEKTFYTPGATGYTDYKPYSAEESVSKF
jgi:N-ethylmaleimide reductase